MKKVRAGRAKRKREKIEKLAEMTDEEREAYLIKCRTRSLKSQVQTAIWDYDHRQYPVTKYNLLKDLLYERLEEITKTQEMHCEKEKAKIEVILDGISYRG